MADLKEFQRKMEKTLDVLASDFAAVRAGRANPAVLDKVSVDYYGAPTPIQQVASVAVAEARTLTITPWDVLCCAPSARPSWPAMWASLPLMTALPSA